MQFMTIYLYIGKPPFLTHYEEYNAVQLNSNSQEPTRFVLILRCSNYEFALNINKCKYNRFSRDRNHLSEITGCLN